MKIVIGLVLALIVILIAVPTAFRGTDSVALLGDILGVIALTALFAGAIAVIAIVVQCLAVLWPFLILGLFIMSLGGK